MVSNERDVRRRRLERGKRDGSVGVANKNIVRCVGGYPYHPSRFPQQKHLLRVRKALLPLGPRCSSQPPGP